MNRESLNKYSRHLSVLKKQVKNPLSPRCLTAAALICRLTLLWAGRGGQQVLELDPLPQVALVWLVES